MRPIPLVLGLLVSVSGPATQVLQRETINCSVTPTTAERPPDDPHSSSFASPNSTWYANGERSLWAWWWGKTSTGDYKVLWVRPTGTSLKISGRRMDAEASGFRVRIPTGYRGYTYQASAIDFPSAGCWEIEARADDARLQLVVRIK
jgi:hypothetical protein